MRYSILGFSQEIVLSLQKERDSKILKLEVLDLLILKDIADFMNRPNIVKYTIDDKTYFSIQYAIIIEDLPIIGIKKQALVDRIDKMVFLGVLEKKVIKNQSGTWVAFRMGEQYEKLLYTCTSSEIHRTSSTLQVQEYSTTTHNTNITNNSINKEIKENIKRKKEGDTPTEKDHEMFEEFRRLYSGKKRGHHTEFNFFIAQNKDWREVLPKLLYAVKNENRLREQAKMTRSFFPEPKNLQTYLSGKNRAWELYSEDYEPLDTGKYLPQCDGVSLFWNDILQCYITPFDISTLADGYCADNRPNGATVMWNGWKYIWDSTLCKWEQQ